MLHFLFELLESLFSMLGTATGCLFDFGGRAISAVADLIFRPISILAGWGMDHHYATWWWVFCAGWAVAILLVLILAGWALAAYRRKKR